MIKNLFAIIGMAASFGLLAWLMIMPEPAPAPKYSGIVTVHNACTKNIAPVCVQKAFSEIGYDVQIEVNSDSCTTTFIIAER